jgi:hypothetical protein
MPKSLGGRHYYLDPGTEVYVVAQANHETLTVTTVANPDDRILEDFFQVPADLLAAIHSDTPRTDALYFGGMMRPSVYDMAGLCKEMERKAERYRTALEEIIATRDEFAFRIAKEALK